jgi:hypothetical protein
MKRNIGGSLLPSNEPRILRAVETPFGVLQVRALPELDTHALFHRYQETTAYPGGETMLAMHPNGYSCYALLERMVAKDVTGVVEQAKYILACGGLTRHFDHIVGSMALNSTEGN